MKYPSERKPWTVWDVVRVSAIILLVLGGGAFLFASQPSTTPTPTPPAQPPAATASATPKAIVTIDKSPATQERRRKLLQKLVNERVFVKIETPGNLPRVSVAPAFYRLDFDTKKSFVSVVYAYHFDGTDPGDTVILLDGRTNKRIGTYTPSAGLDLN